MLVLQVPPQSSQREAPFGAKQLFPALTALSAGRWLTDKELQSFQVQRTGITNRKKTGEELTSSNILRRIWEHTSSAAQSPHVAIANTQPLPTTVPTLWYLCNCSHCCLFIGGWWGEKKKKNFIPHIDYFTCSTQQNIKPHPVLLSQRFLRYDVSLKKFDCTGGGPKALSTLAEQYSTGHEQYVIWSNMHNSE